MLGSATLLQLAFFGENDPNFSKENSHWENKLYNIQNTNPQQLSTNASTTGLLIDSESVRKKSVSNKSVGNKPHG